MSDGHMCIYMYLCPLVYDFQMKGNNKLSPTSSNHSIGVYLVDVSMDSTKPSFGLTSNKKTKFLVAKNNQKSRSKEKG